MNRLLRTTWITFSPAIDAAAFPATPYAGDSGFAWNVNFRDGDIYSYLRDNDHPVWLMRVWWWVLPVSVWAA